MVVGCDVEPLNLTSPPATSIIMSPPRSNVRSPESEIVEPSIVMSSTVSVVRVPRLNCRIRFC